MNKFIPDRKVWAGGIFFVAAWLILQVISTYTHVTFPPSTTEFIAGLLSWGVAYIIPPSQRDILKRLNDEVVAMAAANPKVPVDPTTAPRKK